MTRIRTDNVFGTTTDNPLTNVATTMNSAGLANLAAVAAPDEAIIILDPNRLTGAPEIVVVTAHTGSATSATIVRGQFGTAARQHALGTEWVHGPIAGNTAAFATAADDQGDYVPLGAWTTWVPTLFQGQSVSVTVDRARFVRIGRTITAFAQLTASSVGLAGNAILASIPVTASNANQAFGSFRYFDTGNTNFAGTTEGETTTTVEFFQDGNGNPLGITGAPTIAVNDVLLYQVTYEATS